jgi:hypothetical protein
VRPCACPAVPRPQRLPGAAGGAEDPRGGAPDPGYPAVGKATARAETDVGAERRKPLGVLNAQRDATQPAQRPAKRPLHYAADAAGLRIDGARLRFHDLRHTFASHLIIDLSLDVVQVSRIVGHACPSTTLDIYAHMFDEARHAADVRSRMTGSAFAGLLENDEDEGTVITLPAGAGARSAPLSARQRAAIKWAT